MKHIKLFESYQNSSDIDIIFDIFFNHKYQSLTILKNEINKISDKKLAVGLLVELLSKSEIYEINQEEIGTLLLDFNSKDIDEDEAYDHYFDKMGKDPRWIFGEFIESMEGEISENSEFTKWIKSLSKEDFQRVEKYCVDTEQYEIISYIKSTWETK